METHASEINQVLLQAGADLDAVLPHLAELREQPLVLNVDFGLGELPTKPGIISVRGARQYGKSTWLEGQVRDTIEACGAGSALYLNGDELRDETTLARAIRAVMPLFAAKAPVRRLFIDEITAIPNWHVALKRLADAGELRKVLVVTTGSRASDLRQGSERLPGRKGKLDRTSFLFTPVSYREFRRSCGERLGRDTLPAYVLSGGAPVACTELALNRRLPEYVIEMIRDWIYGEVARSSRQRSSLLAVMHQLHRFACSPIGQAKLAREAGLANNTVAAGYIELLADLTAVGFGRAWDASLRVRPRRKPAKFPFTNLLVAAAWSKERMRTPQDFESLSSERRGGWWEWLVAQELWRRAARRGDDTPEELTFWHSREHELDFVVAPDEFLEVKLGKVSPIDFAWFPTVFGGNARLTVIAASRFETDRMRAVSMEEFLLEEP